MQRAASTDLELFSASHKEAGFSGEITLCRCIRNGLQKTKRRFFYFSFPLISVTILFRHTVSKSFIEPTCSTYLSSTETRQGIHCGSPLAKENAGGKAVTLLSGFFPKTETSSRLYWEVIDFLSFLYGPLGVSLVHTVIALY